MNNSGYAHGSMKSTEVMFAGSLVATEALPEGLLSTLQFNITPDEIVDEFARAMFKAALRANDDGWTIPPTAENLAMIMLQERETILPSMPPAADVQAVNQQREALLQQIALYAEAGTATPNGLNSLAGVIRQHSNLKRLDRAAQKVTSLAQDPDMVPIDKYEEMSATVEAARPDLIEARVYTLKDQQRLINEMTARQIKRLGQKLPTFPSEWSLESYIPFMLSGLLYTLTGLTGRGKSSMLQMIAHHLARTGFKVVYFHLEDDIERQIMRYTRRLTRATARELIAGDPRKMFGKAIALLTSILQNSGGEVIYVHCPNASPEFIRSRTQLLKPDAIIVDYLQKLNITAYLKQSDGNKAAAMGMAVERLKQVAENDKHNCIVVMGSQEAEYENGERKGTSETRKAEHYAQAIIEVERVKLNENDTPEQVGEHNIAVVGQLSGFAYVNVIKNNDGETGSSPGIFNGLTFTFKSLEFRRWERENPGINYPIPTLQRPDEKYLKMWESKAAAWDDLDLAFEHPKARRKTSKNGGGGNAKAKQEPVPPKRPDGHVGDWGNNDDDNRIPF
jgi:hypothetical protein